jgi:hypothetical protein
MPPTFAAGMPRAAPQFATAGTKTALALSLGAVAAGVRSREGK